MRNVRCWTRPLTALAVAMIFLSGCAGVGFETTLSACPPVVAYSHAEQAQAAAELESFPKGAMIGEMLADYAVLRDQARACR
jgi:hypothetical protein